MIPGRFSRKRKRRVRRRKVRLTVEIKQVRLIKSGRRTYEVADVQFELPELSQLVAVLSLLRDDQLTYQRRKLVKGIQREWLRSLQRDLRTRDMFPAEIEGAP